MDDWLEEMISVLLLVNPPLSKCLSPGVLESPPLLLFLFMSHGGAMPKFKVGDQVERVGTLVPSYMKNGVVVRVIPDAGGQGWFTEYEVNFGNKLIATFYETQLRLFKSGDDSN